MSRRPRAADRPYEAFTLGEPAEIYRRPRMPQQPADPFTALSEGMTQMHEMFAQMRSSGFSERQSLELTKEMIRVGMEQSQRECPHCGKPMNG